MNWPCGVGETARVLQLLEHKIREHFEIFVRLAKLAKFFSQGGSESHFVINE